MPNIDRSVIAGIGQTEVGEHWEISLRRPGAATPFRTPSADSGGLQPQALFVGNMLAPNLSNQAHLGALLADYAGLTGIEAVTMEAAGASGGAALRQGYLAVASGMVDVALVVGVEKFTDKIGPDVDAALATTFDSDFEAVQGMTPTAQAALLMRRYMHEYEVPEHGFAGFAVTAHANGAGNPMRHVPQGHQARDLCQGRDGQRAAQHVRHRPERRRRGGSGADAARIAARQIPRTRW